MTQQVVFVALGLVFVFMAVITPQMLTLRIRVLKFLHLRGLADWHQRNFDGLVKYARLVLAAMALAALIFGIFFN
ncbi:MAG: hypothetical protein AB1483_09595 [Candidatus Zixiibacteriota bacterium]